MRTAFGNQTYNAVLYLSLYPTYNPQPAGQQDNGDTEYLLRFFGIVFVEDILNPLKIR